MQGSAYQCIIYLHSRGRNPTEPTGLHTLHATRKVAVFSGGPNLNDRRISVNAGCLLMSEKVAWITIN